MWHKQNKQTIMVTIKSHFIVPVLPGHETDEANSKAHLSLYDTTYDTV